MANLKKILLVDDDEDLREALSEQLVMTEDFDVFEAGNGADAMVKPLCAATSPSARSNGACPSATVSQAVQIRKTGA